MKHFTVTLSCATHPRYQAIYAPRGTCYACQEIWSIKCHLRTISSVESLDKLRVVTSS